MKLPRDISGDRLASALASLGYVKLRQKGSHMRLVTDAGGQFHISIPRQDSIKIGTPNHILRELEKHREMSREQLMNRLGL